MICCPYCGKAIQPDSAFCIHCGEPTDEDSVRELTAGGRGRPPGDAGWTEALARDAKPGRRRLAWSNLLTPGRGLEFLFGVLLLLGVTGFGVFTSIQQNALASHYRAARAAASNRDLDRAAGEFEAATGYRDAGQQLKDVRAQITTRDRFYQAGVKASQQGKWWEAASDLEQAATIQPSYRDLAALLARARAVDGVLVYQVDRITDGKGAIYTSQANGSEAQALPGSDENSQVLALSGDGKWLVYSVASAGGTNRVVLYNAAGRAAREMAVPAPLVSGPVAARFMDGDRAIWIEMGGDDYVFTVPTLSGDGGLLPDPSQGPSIDLRRGITLLPTVGHNILEVGGYSGGSPRFTAAEAGPIDDVVFSPDGGYLLYRVGPADGSTDTWSVKLVDLKLPSMSATTVATMTVTNAQSDQWTLTSEFTRDGRYVLVIKEYNDIGSAALYNIETATTTRIEDGYVSNVPWSVVQAPMVSGGVPSLQLAQGANSLARANGGRRTGLGAADRVSRYGALSHWVEVSRDGRNLVYLGGSGVNTLTGTNAQMYMLYVERLRGSAGSGIDGTRLTLLRTAMPPESWLPYSYLLPDGQTFVSTVAPVPGEKRGLYAYDLTTGEGILFKEGVTQLWQPGYASLSP